MPNTYTAVTQQSGDWWIGWIEENPGINCQEPTREKLLESLREALGEAIELNREDARSRAEPGFAEEPISA
jgi:predicted RNase H-like HicB family nuclease